MRAKQEYCVWNIDKFERIEFEKGRMSMRYWGHRGAHDVIDVYALHFIEFETPPIFPYF